jgi:RHS repeat-associated protein
MLYDAFGKVTGGGGDADRYRYTGTATDPLTGLVGDDARAYDPASGRWLSEDPLGLTPDVNPFRYVGNRATTESDPSGLVNPDQLKAPAPTAVPVPAVDGPEAPHDRQFEGNKLDQQTPEAALKELLATVEKLQKAQIDMSIILQDLTDSIDNPFGGNTPTFSPHELSAISKDYEVIYSTTKDDIMGGKWELKNPMFAAINLGNTDSGFKRYIYFQLNNTNLNKNNDGLSNSYRDRIDIMKLNNGLNYSDARDLDMYTFRSGSYYEYSGRREVRKGDNFVDQLNVYVDGRNTGKKAEELQRLADGVTFAWVVAAHMCPVWNVVLTVAEQNEDEKKGGKFNWGEVVVAVLDDGTTVLGYGAFAKMAKAKKTLDGARATSLLRTTKTMFAAEAIVKTGIGTYRVAESVKEFVDGNAAKGWLKITDGLFRLVGAKTSAAQFTQAKDALRKAEKAVADAATKAAKLGSSEAVDVVLSTGCFAAGTMLLTPDGYRPIETFEAGDLILTRDQDDPNGPLTTGVVERTFRRYAGLRTAMVNGRQVRLTGEHPLYTSDGWTEAHELAEGSRVLGLGGEWLSVDVLGEVSEHEVVYNLEVRGAHTFFVGGPDWGIAVWVHNVSATLCADLLRLRNQGPKTPEEISRLEELEGLSKLRAKQFDTDNFTDTDRIILREYADAWEKKLLQKIDPSEPRLAVRPALDTETDVSRVLGNNLSGGQDGGNAMRKLGLDAHHIVAWNKDEAKGVRDFLLDNGFTLDEIKYGTFNGVWLPGAARKNGINRGVRESVYLPESWHKGAPAEASKHSKLTFNTIRDRLVPLQGNKQAMIDEIKQIGIEMQDGVFRNR